MNGKEGVSQVDVYTQYSVIIIRRSLSGLIPHGLPWLKVRIYWKDEQDHPKRT